uniref:NADH-ubiquinone oxidoreductase chain 4 n=6 Tax=Perna canaliculus TaxID=38949 RepID=A0A2I6RMD2_PERCI|nr:NADH dehydrogenase subunit 4 [Perna canaliculus]AUN88101.1 NADH dehydrogenase subunit 4 [Perna canaliculus]QPD06654.1 NADH dehydrogenase subunit 4 [Perna canaliculus]QPD06667.1 NADH dehydrogenase subunit 4 [Perna canaliculus]UJM44254.1 NADH dehydrogenase subunit 4 [Perna canaliculus]
MAVSLIISLIMLFVLGNSTISLMVLSFFLFLTVLEMGTISDEFVALGGSVSYDLLSYSLSVLSIFIMLLSLMSSKSVQRIKLFYFMNLALLMVLVLAFCTSSFLGFFFFFESALIPLILIIMGWGYQFERMEASTYMFIYTVFGSLFFLFGVCLLFYSGMSDNMLSLGSNISKKVSGFWWLFVLGFLVKLPVYPFHLWLPKAHVEAPVAGSMVLAGVVLKLGGYGLLRLMMVMSVNLGLKSLNMMLSIGMVGGVYASLVCCRQTDLKCLVAYSSVGHMSLVMLGCLSNISMGVKGALFIMVGHGLCSSGMFSLVNVFYNHSGYRNLYMNKGFLMKSPVLCLVGFLLCSSNMAAPPSLNLFGEVLMFVCSYLISFCFLVLLMVMTIISAVYSLHLYTTTCHGKSSEAKVSLETVSYSAVFVLLVHWIPLNFIFLFIP